MPVRNGGIISFLFRQYNIIWCQDTWKLPGIVPQIYGIVEPFGMQKRLRDHVRILKGDGGDVY